MSNIRILLIGTVSVPISFSLKICNNLEISTYLPNILNHFVLQYVKYETNRLGDAESGSHDAFFLCDPGRLF